MSAKERDGENEREIYHTIPRCCYNDETPSICNLFEVNRVATLLYY